MYNKILVPVDLAHLDHLDKALRTAADLCRHYGAALVYVGITAPTPSAVAHNPQEFTAKLEAFGRAQADAFGIDADVRAYTSHDPVVDVDDTLLRAVRETGADLVVMASHIPTAADYLWPSNGGKVASHSEASVFVVR